MGVNIKSLIQEQAKEQAEKVNRVRINYFKPKVGENPIRLLPPWRDDWENFCLPFFVHWCDIENGKRLSFTCTRKTDQFKESGDCKICQAIDEIMANKENIDPAVFKEIEKSKAKKRYRSNIIDLSDPTYTEEDLKDKGDDFPHAVGDMKVKVYDYGFKTHKDLRNSFTVWEKDLSDHKDGQIIVISRVGTGMNDTTYSVTVHPKPHSIDSDLDELREVMYNLEEITAPRDEELTEDAAFILKETSNYSLPASSEVAASLPSKTVTMKDTSKEVSIVDFPLGGSSEGEDDIEKVLKELKAKRVE